MTLKIKGKTVLVLAAGAGMILTAWLAARNTPEAQKRKEEALQAKREATGDENAELTFFESAKAQFGAYVPAIVSGMVTIGSLVGSEVINNENLKKAEKAVDDFKTMADKLDGKGSSKIIEKAVEQKKLDEKAHKPWNVEETFRIRFQNQTIEFKSTRSDVIEAFYETNRYFQGRGHVTFNEFLQYLGQKSVKEGDDRGWEAYVGEAVYGYTWIDFGLKQCEDEPWITDIYFAVYPHFFDEEDCYTEIDEDCKKLLSSPEKSKVDEFAEKYSGLKNKDIPVELKLDMSDRASGDGKKDAAPPW